MFLLFLPPCSHTFKSLITFQSQRKTDVSLMNNSKIVSRQFVGNVAVHIWLGFFDSFFLLNLWWRNVCHIWSMHEIECHSYDMEIYYDHGRKECFWKVSRWNKTFFNWQRKLKIKLTELQPTHHNNETFFDFIKTLLIKFSWFLQCFELLVQCSEWIINIKNFRLPILNCNY